MRARLRLTSSGLREWEEVDEWSFVRKRIHVCMSIWDVLILRREWDFAYWPLIANGGLL